MPPHPALGRAEPDPRAPAVMPIWHKEEKLPDVDILILPGGFSYGDYLRTGAIAAYSPIMKAVIEHARAGGVVLGICNGFQILTESGLLPGALLRNKRLKFICKSVWVRVENSKSILTSNFTNGEVISMPIAHAEGNYYIEPAGLQNLIENNQIIFRYCNLHGTLTESANPNGSLDNIAGICNKAGNVFGMMPHPERTGDVWAQPAAPLQHTVDGIRMFLSLLQNPSSFRFSLETA
ncbi:MAG: phosphoribosylformylglycinamidine synthase I [Nitrospirae bacterium]|nr:phosphoribosylformylglycinamidine synthase I [Candidatus Troglogloeales bacterium]MBI3598170.1 phosphoribosylformylglycinamidine synthase I [Candidatus Troglogloeales bacterium]